MPILNNLEDEGLSWLTRLGSNMMGLNLIASWLYNVTWMYIVTDTFSNLMETPVDINGNVSLTPSDVHLNFISQKIDCIPIFLFFS